MEKTNRRKTLALISIMLGAFISLLDTTIVNVALPDITVALHATSQSIEWIISGYALAFGVVLILAGRLGDRFGRKNLYIFGILLFLIMSITAGYAQSEESLIISRVIQGLGAGLFFPQINAVIMDMYSGKHLGKIFGILGSVIGVGTAIGPLAGGLLIELFGADNGWRAVFFVNVPIVLVTLVLAMLYLPKHQAPKEKVRFDIPGVLGLTLALMMLLYPVISRGSNGFRLVDYIWMASSIPVFLLLYWWSVRQAKRGNQPLISPNLLKNQPFVSGMVLSLVYFAAFTSIFFILSVTWQTGFGQSAISSGLAITPFAIGSVLAAANSNRFIMKIGRKLLHLGVLLVIIGLSGVSLVFHLHDGVFSAWWMALPLFTAGIGSGLIIAPLNSFTLSTVVGPERGGASGMFNTAQRIGSSFGIAVVGSVFFRTLDHTTAHSKANAFSDSLQMSMYVNIALLVVCFVLVFRLPRKI
ncbi:MFS transporter [Listeria booriae]|uniref:MFS transporter n=1 Tax=Listeria booriae TaxID=1552123 RepID=A0A842AIF2_9LIST|nr:MFS transporter [Listeria booriae]MBC1290778.1 MFS transporter [Listeria booriae]MBC1400787.1 MFS transporter [Listeria booriae]MBC1616634.1 MFS transporter [Listeria booriae]MBC6129276.1 MFS transporter [Listeria booriae]